MPNISIPTPEIFSFTECLRFLQRSDKECLFRVNKGRIEQLISINGKPVFITISQPDPNKLCVDYTWLEEGVETENLIKNYVEDWLDLKTDLRPFYEMADHDPLLTGLAKNFHGLRLIGIPSLFEALGWSVIGQQINLTFAYSLKRQLVEKHGHSQKIDGQTYFIFPKQETIANLSVQDLKTIQFSKQKADYLIGVAKILSRGDLTKKGLSQLSFEEAKEELTKIRGIGNWSANYVLMKCIRHPQAFPIEDVGLHNAIKQQLSLSNKPDISTLRKMAEPWGKWKAYATFYLWHSLLKD